MFSGKKIAVVSGLLGGIAMTFAGANQANAGEATASCSPYFQTCIQNNSGYASPDGSLKVNQSQDCLGTKPVAMPAGGLLNRGATQIGPQLTCSNRNPATQAQAQNQQNPGQLPQENGF
ncbi:hypothetical protein FCH28_33540 [Streptomyces piniterrae]|uniref:Intersectin-EH binding protein Ibp1 n=1 Tax=Streptomyces piniterrae TaxID=2571125 RepID=A0A4V5MI46_9ACTN|nr:hypothetical protein [Streptomyces piniterrae]TJZ42818.1 hypothetical protein FCH28_33540 [Streptomyces piniterrae]